MSTRIKICGITCVEDAVAVTELGVDEIGLNFYRASPRYVGLNKARQIAAEIPPGVKKVGVFVNASIEAVLSYAHFVGLDAIQLHGDETADYVREVREKTDRFLIKAMTPAVLQSVDPTAVLPIDAVLIDTPHSGEYGGTGESFDWNLLGDEPAGARLFYLAGGLSPANVAAAIRQLRPFAVDACSRLESVKGRKDLAKVEHFIREVRQAV